MPQGYRQKVLSFMGQISKARESWREGADGQRQMDRCREKTVREVLLPEASLSR